MPSHPPKLVLASRSPRRRELLTEAGYDFEVVVPDEAAECGICSRETPEKLVARLARQKAANVVRENRQGTGPRLRYRGRMRRADPGQTGRRIARPADVADAQRTRASRAERALSVERARRQPAVRVAVTRLRMDRLSAAEIDDYVSSGLWEGKAGAFGYQDRLGWIHVVEGSETNVVGLPMELLAEMLTEMTNDE